MPKPQLSPIGRFEKVMLATTKTTFNTSAEHVAIKLSQKLRSQLFVLSVLSIEPDDFKPFSTIPPNTDDSTEHLATIKSDAENEGVTCSTMIKQGKQRHTEIINGAEELQSDLVILGRHNQSDFPSVASDTTAKVVGGARCKVLVVPRDANIWNNGILLATDGSRYSDRAGVNAINLAKSFKIPLTILSVINDSQDKVQSQEAMDVVKRVGKFARKEGLKVKELVLEGSPVETILETVSKMNIDLIVGGRKGKASSASRAILGDVMQKIIVKADCAILVVRGG
jgi:nucleotide-binding universal stress UspA family protein